MKDAMLYGSGVAAMLIGLLVSIAWHELGHFAAARRFGVRVTEFMVGFGPTLWAKRRGETLYGFRIIPLGGYIRMIGMFPPHSKLGFTEHEALPIADRSRVFHLLHPAKKIVVMAAGPLMNLIMAVALLSIAVGAIGVPVPTAKIEAVAPCVQTTQSCDAPPAALIGLQAGDRVVSMAGTAVTDWPSLVEAIDRNADKQVAVIVERGDERVTLQGLVGSNESGGYLGITPASTTQRATPGEIVTYTISIVGRTAQAIGNFPARLAELVGVIVTGQPRDPEGPIGVVGLARISGETASEQSSPRLAVLDVLLLLAGLNVSLFVFNLIPLVPLDGGHVLTATIEWVRRAVARIRGRMVPPAIDGVRLLPVTYVVAAFLLLSALLVTVADVLQPLGIG